MDLLDAMQSASSAFGPPSYPEAHGALSSATALTPRALQRAGRSGPRSAKSAPHGAVQAPAVQLGGPLPSHGARFVAIAGNIGAGKSTLTAFLASRFGIQPFYEPNDSNPYLTDFYADMGQYAFHSQVYFLSAKFRAHLGLARLLDEQPKAVFVQDRTIYEDAEIFAKTLHTRGVLPDRDHLTYDSLYAGIRDALPRPDLLIYLRCSLRGLKRRIRARGRPEEQAMDPTYLSDLQDAYESWIDRYDLSPKLVIETERLDYLSHLCDRLDLEKALGDLLPK